MIYFDTAYLLKCYVPERGHDDVLSLWRANAPVACSEFGRMEFAGALHRVCREGRLTQHEMQLILARWRIDQSHGLWHWLPMDEQLAEAVASTFETLPTSIFLRTGDAIHILSARENGIQTVYSNDKHLQHAARFLGLAVGDVIP